MIRHKPRKHSNYSFAVKFLTALLFLASTIIYLNQQQSASANKPSADTVAFSKISGGLKVKRVIDGDTIVLTNGETVRYLGVDTPETHVKRNGRFQADIKPFGREAEDFNRKLVEGKTLVLEYDRERTDKYDRTLAYVYADGVFVNAELIKGGYAGVFIKSPNVKYADKFVELQRQARLEKRGLWGAYEKVRAQDAGDYIGQLRVVTGKVMSTGASGKMIFLNFGTDKNTDFTVLIYSDALKYFRQAGIDPLTFYTGKTVEVGGKIRRYRGPEIIVGWPREIEVVE